jgi:hypothetical protein
VDQFRLQRECYSPNKAGWHDLEIQKVILESEHGNRTQHLPDSPKERTEWLTYSCFFTSSICCHISLCHNEHMQICSYILPLLFGVIFVSLWLHRISTSQCVTDIDMCMQ